MWRDIGATRSWGLVYRKTRYRSLRFLPALGRQQMSTEKGSGEILDAINEAKKQAWAEGYYAGVTENYGPGDEEEAEEIRDRANGFRNPYQEEN